MTLHSIPSNGTPDGPAAAPRAAAARIRSAVEAGRSCPHLGAAMCARIEEAVALHQAGLISEQRAERAIVEAENLAVALAPLAPG